jgi:hypothetical protein
MTSENINLAILTEGDFLSEGNITLIGGISKIYFNKKNFDNTDVSALLRFVGVNRESFLVKMRNSNNLNDSVYFRVTGITEFQDYFTVDTLLEINNDALNSINPYDVYFFDFELKSSDLVTTLPEFNRIVTSTGFTSNPGEIIFNSGWSWLIKNVSYNNIITQIIPITPTLGYKRIDVIVVNTQNSFQAILGTETLGSPAKPSIPIDTIEVTFIIVGDTGVETIEPIDLSNYATKNYVDTKTIILSDRIDAFEQSGSFPKMQFVANGIDATFDLGTVISAKAVFWNGALLDDADWSQVDNILTLTFIPSNGEPIKPI